MDPSNPYDTEAGETSRARRKGTFLVIVGGVATSLLALFGVWLLGQYAEDFNIMGWYAMFVIPAGAILVGMLAGVGYCLVSWWRGVKITGLLLWSVLALQVACWVEAQYLEYRAVAMVFVHEDGTPLSFTEYFDFATQSMTFSRKGQGGGQPLGMWGYAFRALELAGFALGGLIPSLVLGAKPYCEMCQVYMKTKSQGWLPAGVIPRKVNKKDTAAQEAYAAEIKTAFEQGVALVQTAVEHTNAGNAAAFRELMAQHKPQHKEIQKQSSRIDVQLHYCPRCHGGNLHVICFTGHGEEQSQQDLLKQDVDPQFVRGCLEGIA